VAYRDLSIALKLALLGAFLSATTVAVGVGGWRALAHLRELQVASCVSLSRFAQAADTARVAQVDFKKQVQEWKDLLLRGGGDPAAFEKYRSAFSDESDTTQRELQSLKTQLNALDVASDKVDSALTTHADLRNKYLQALTHFDASDATSAHKVDGEVQGIDRAPTLAIDDIVAFVMQRSADASAQINQSGADAYSQACVLLLAIVFCALSSGVVVTWVLSRSITGPIRRAVEVAQAVAAGDLCYEVQVTSGDETGQLLAALNDMNFKLRAIVSEIRDCATSISSSTQQIAAGNLDLSARTEQQAASLEETAASMQHFTEAVQSNALSAGDASLLAGSASGAAQDGGRVISEAVLAMERINGSSKKIADIIGTIEAIAAQTNILALNAAVEAARAGDEGRGFAVVANEVRGLANRSAEAARQIKVLISESVASIGTGSQLIGRASETMAGLLASVERVTLTVGEIATSSADQASGIRQVNDAIAQMDQVTQSNAALVEQAAAAADAVQARAMGLVASVQVFKLNSSLAEAL